MQDFDIANKSELLMLSTEGKPKKKYGKKLKKNDEFEATFIIKLYQASDF